MPSEGSHPTPSQLAAWNSGKAALVELAGALAGEGLSEDVIREALQAAHPGMWEACWQNAACAVVMSLVGQAIDDTTRLQADRRALAAKGMPAHLADRGAATLRAAHAPTPKKRKGIYG